LDYVLPYNCRNQKTSFPNTSRYVKYILMVFFLQYHIMGIFLRHQPILFRKISFIFSFFYEIDDFTGLFLVFNINNLIVPNWQYFLEKKFKVNELIQTCIERLVIFLIHNIALIGSEQTTWIKWIINQQIHLCITNNTFHL
jgi:hypothetical protein